MKSTRQMPSNPYLLLVFFLAVVFLTAGCSSSSSSSDGNLNPLGAYQSGTSTSTGTVTDGTTQNPGAISEPIVSTTDDSSTSVDGHGNAPLLDNMHPGWQQEYCLSCHNDTTRNPDHYYTDTSLCYLCHGTNGLPGFADDVAPVISGVSSSVTDTTCTISWKTDEDCIARLTVKTTEGDKVTIPVTTVYGTSHKYTLTGLASSRTYTYEIVVFDKSRNQTSSSNYGALSFTTMESTTVTVNTSTSTSTSTSTGTDTDVFFSNFTLDSPDPYSVRITCNFSSAIQSGNIYWFSANDTTSPIDSEGISSGATKVDYTWTGMTANTQYGFQIRIVDNSGVSRKTTVKYVTTDAL